MLVPIEYEEQLRGDYRLLLDCVRPRGSIQVFYRTNTADEPAPSGLARFVQGLRGERLYATLSPVCASDVIELSRMSARVLRNSFFRPNILFANIEGRSESDLREFVEIARSAEMGVTMLVLHPTARLGRERDITIWVREQSPNWELGLRLANLDLALLLGYQLNRNWGGRLILRCVIQNPLDRANAQTFLDRLIRDARLPNGRTQVVEGTFLESLASAEDTDLNIFGLSDALAPEELQKLAERTRSSCLLVMDSGHESALA